MKFSTQGFFVLVMYGLLSLADGSASANGNWTRDVTEGKTMAAYPAVSLVLLLTSSIDDHLLATCGYRYLDRIGPTALHGRFDSDGRFWPWVRYEVATGQNKWRIVAQANKPLGSVVVEIDFIKPRALLNVDMGPFRTMIGKYRWGRLVLENGEAATFPLDDLLPTGDSPEDADFKTTIGDAAANRFGSSFSLVAVTCFSKHLSGEFAFVCPEKRCVAELAGLRDSNGDFSPVVTWQAGNSDQDWQTLKESGKVKGGDTLKLSNEKSPQTIRVDLDPYRSVIGRLKYGKILFSSGDFSVFELDKLKPSFMNPPSVPEP